MTQTQVCIVSVAVFSVGSLVKFGYRITHKSVLGIRCISEAVHPCVLLFKWVVPNSLERMCVSCCRLWYYQPNRERLTQSERYSLTFNGPRIQTFSPVSGCRSGRKSNSCCTIVTAVRHLHHDRHNGVVLCLAAGLHTALD